MPYASSPRLRELAMDYPQVPAVQPFEEEFFGF
jgi:hypothetical protein